MFLVNARRTRSVDLWESLRRATIIPKIPSAKTTAEMPRWRSSPASIRRPHRPIAMMIERVATTSTIRPRVCTRASFVRAEGGPAAHPQSRRMPTALGLHHRALAAVAALQRRKEGWGVGRFAIEGHTLLEEALAGGLDILEVYATPSALREHPGVLRLEARGTPVFTVPEPAMRRISDLQTPPGLLAVVNHPPVPLGDLMAERGPILAIALSDPGNAGTLVRSARAFGAIGIVLGRVVVVGHERHGVRSWLPVRDAAVRIPQQGVESLNAAVAGSIVLYQLMLSRGGS